MRLKEGEIRIPSGCAIAGILNRNGRRFSGKDIITCIKKMHQRSNGLGGGFAAYGIYPELKDYYALHIYFDNERAKLACEAIVKENLKVRLQEPIPVRQCPTILEAPIIWRYFTQPREEKVLAEQISEEEFMVKLVMSINAFVNGAYVVSSGKNMGVFKGVGYPEDIGEFFKLEDYQAYLWSAHGRFPTNTPGWWGGAHPFALLDLAVVHNGEISSYCTNRRFLEMNGYRCTLQTDTEAITYAFDLLMRKQKLDLQDTIDVIAAPFWETTEDKKVARYRRIYSSLLLNGPFSIIVTTRNGLVALNDRIKLRPLMAATKDEFLYVASEEAAIRAIEPNPEYIWSPGGSEPVLGLVKGKSSLFEAGTKNMAQPA
ncbi:MAG: hypothetical protein GX550_01655 [Syntrophomonadaceae bacterium]|nr:hypothetical protein [Syntrophomonadaceae bacterium]